MQKISLILVVFIFTIQLFGVEVTEVNSDLKVVSPLDTTALCFFEEEIEYIEGYDKQGYDKRGYDRDGYDRAGKDKYGYKKGNISEVIEIIKPREYRKDIYPACIKATQILRVSTKDTEDLVDNSDNSGTTATTVPIILNTTLTYAKVAEPVKIDNNNLEVNDPELKPLEANDSELKLQEVKEVITAIESSVSYPLYYESGCILSENNLSNCRLSNGVRKVKQPVLTTVPRITTIKADVQNCGENIPPIYVKVTNTDNTSNSILLKNNEKINLYKRKGESIKEIKIDHYGYEEWTKSQIFPKDCRVSIIIDSNKVDCRNSESDLVTELEEKYHVYNDAINAYSDLLLILPAYEILDKVISAIQGDITDASEYLRDNYSEGDKIYENIQNMLTKSRDLTLEEEARYQELINIDILTNEENEELTSLEEKRIFSLSPKERAVLRNLLAELGLLVSSTDVNLDDIFDKATINLLKQVSEKVSGENILIYKNKVEEYGILIGEVEDKIQRVGLELKEAGCIPTVIGEDE
jgi:hypothetical protein